MSAEVKRHRVRGHFRTSASDARLTASQSSASKRRLQAGKNFIKKGQSTPQGPFLPSLPLVNPRTTSYPQETLQGRASFRFPTYDFKLVHVFCSRLSQPEKLHKKNLKTLAKKTKSQPTHTKKEKKNQQNQQNPLPPDHHQSPLLLKQVKTRNLSSSSLTLRPADSESDRFPHHAVPL